MMVGIMNRWKRKGEPRHGLSNPYKSQAKARQMAKVLTELYGSRGWTFSVLQFDSQPVSWIVLRERALPGKKPARPTKAAIAAESTLPG